MGSGKLLAVVVKSVGRVPYFVYTISWTKKIEQRYVHGRRHQDIQEMTTLYGRDLLVSAMKSNGVREGIGRDGAQGKIY
jgi:hypothetical protein